MSQIKAGDLYKRTKIEGVTFEIYYGYAVDGERDHGWEPSPLYPDFSKNPQFTPRGSPFALAYQDKCKHYQPLSQTVDDHWCYNCKFFDQREQFIGICTCTMHIHMPHRDAL